MSVLHPIDWIVILAYFALIAGIVCMGCQKAEKDFG